MKCYNINALDFVIYIKVILIDKQILWSDFIKQMDLLEPTRKLILINI